MAGRETVLQSVLQRMLTKQYRNSPAPLQQWAQGPLRNYLTRRFGTPEDELNQMVQAGAVIQPGVGPQGFRNRALHLGYKVHETPEEYVSALVQRQLGKQPEYLLHLPTDTARLGAVTDAWLRKWTDLGGPEEKYKGWGESLTSPGKYRQVARQYFPNTAKFWSEVVDPLDYEFDAILPEPRNLKPEAAENIQDVFRRYMTKAGGQEEFGSALSQLKKDLIRKRLLSPLDDGVFHQRPLQNVASPAQNLFRVQTSPLKQMYEYDLASNVPYEGAKFKGSMGSSGSRNPFVSGPLAGIRNTLLQDEPWLARWTPEQGALREFFGITPDIRHITDVLVDDLAAGRVRPDVLPRMSMREAGQRTVDWNRNMERRNTERVQRAAAELLKDPKGITPVAEYPEGWRVDQVTNADRLTKESCAAGATWCTRSDAIAQNYLEQGPFYLLRDPSGVARVAFQTDKAGKVHQIRNRKQTRDLSEETKPFVRRFLIEHPGFQDVEPNELRTADYTPAEWRAARRALPPPEKKRAGGHVHA